MIFSSLKVLTRWCKRYLSILSVRSRRPKCAGAIPESTLTAKCLGNVDKSDFFNLINFLTFKSHASPFLELSVNKDLVQENTGMCNVADSAFQLHGH